MSIHNTAFRHCRIFFNSVTLHVEKLAGAPTLLQRRNKIGAETRGAKHMKYILLMTGTKEGVDAYKSWSEKDIQTHFAHLTKYPEGFEQIR
jgi:hypothetical protein